MTLSKYNEVMENIVIDDEMKKRLLENIEKEIASDVNADKEQNINAKEKEDIINFDSDRGKESKGNIIKFVYRYGSRVAVFALVMLGAYGVIRVVGLNSNRSSETASYSADMAEETATYESDSAIEEAAEATEAAADSQMADGESATDIYSDDAADSYVADAEGEAVEDAGKGINSLDPSKIKDSAESVGGSKEYGNEDSAKATAEDEESYALKGIGEELKITMAGDVLLHTPVAEAGENEAGDYDFDFIFDETRDEIESADIAIVNQEVVLGGKELGITGYPSFNAPYELGDALVNAGFDVICHATNHVLDKGKKGLLNTIEFWKNNYPDITVAGINETKEEYDQVRILERNGIKVAVLNYTYGLNGIEVPSDMPYAVDILEESKVIADLEYAEENADFTIVCPHWGTEYNHGIDSMQRKWTDIFREYGADLVIGTHPHVIEPVEMLEDGEAGITNNHGNGDMLVYYSIGNFVNWTSGSGDGTADRMVGGLANITLGRDKNGEVCIDDYGIRAIVCHVESGDENITVYPLSEYPDAKAKKNEIIDQDSKFSKDYCKKLCDDIWGELWK